MTDPISLPGWNEAARLGHCHRCDWAFVTITAAAGPDARCPHCAAAILQPLHTQVEHLPSTHPPELVAAPTLAPAGLERALRGFIRSIPLAPSDLTLARLRQRAQLCYLPRWLVDASVAATWQAEAGFDYEIVSHEEHFDGERNHWRSQEVTETRVRWEPRLGKLQRRYENVPVPALEEEALIRRQLGDFAAAQAAAYRPESLENAVVALPNRSPEDAWEEARPLFGQRARRDCKQAAGADHMRSFRWTPQFTAPQWTQLLLPVYATHYQDDDGRYRPILIHGQTGRVQGVRRASGARARRIALLLGLAAALLLLLSLAALLGGQFLDAPAAASLGVAALLLGLLAAAMAVTPLLVVALFNRAQTRSGPALFVR